MMLRRTPRAGVRGGFTLMEMLVVVTIIVVLAGIAVPIYLRYVEDAKRGRVQADVQTLTTAVEAYRMKFGDFPASLAVLTQPAPDGGPAYLEPTALLDPWNREYQYAPRGTHHAATGKADIWSLGSNPGDPNGIIGNW